MPRAATYCYFVIVMLCLPFCGGFALTLDHEILLDGVPLPAVDLQFPAGAILTVALQMGSPEGEAVTALAVEATLPTGWTYLDANGAAPPQLAPVPGSTDTLEFLWYDLPAFPARFSYRVQTPVGETGVVTLRNQAYYRTQSAELASLENTIALTGVVPDCAPRISAEGPRGIWVTPNADLAVTLTALVQPPTSLAFCVPSTIQVEYEANGEVLGVSTDSADRYRLDALLPSGAAYTLTARAVDSANATQAEDSWTVDVRAGTDMNSNGYPDMPFAELLSEGDLWEYWTADAGVHLRMFRFEPNDGSLSENVTLTIENPDGSPGKTVLEAARSVLQAGEHGILVLAVADQAHLADLVATGEEGALISSLPTGLVAGYRFALAAALIQKTDGTVSLMDGEYLTEYPLKLSMNGLTLENRLQEAFAEYPVILEGDDPTNLGFVPIGTGWTSQVAEQPVLPAGVLQAYIHEPGIYVPHQGSPPVLATTPAAGSTLSTSLTYPPQRERRMSVTMRNAGGGWVSGSLAVRDAPFSLIGPSAFRLGPGEQRVVQIWFRPTRPGQFKGALIITNDAGVPIRIQLSGTAIKRRTSTGCNGEESGAMPGAGISDAAVVMGLLGLFGVFRKRHGQTGMSAPH